MDAILDTLLEETQPQGGIATPGLETSFLPEPSFLSVQGGHDKWPSGANRGIAKVSYTHDALIDQIIANPCVTQDQLAATFGYTPGWVSQIMSSDAFQAKLASRKDELIDPQIRASVEANFKALVLRSQEILMEKLNKPSHQVPDILVMKALEVSTKAAGYGVKDLGGGINVNLDVHLESMGAGLVDLLRKKRSESVIEGGVQRV